MFIRRCLVLMVLAGPAGALVGCNKQPVLTTPSGEQSAFAEHYPARLAEIRTRFSEEEARTRDSFDGIRTLPSRLRHDQIEDLDVLLEVVHQADAAGRSQYYVDETLRQEDMLLLFSEGRGALKRRVAGSVAYTLKDQECAKEHQAELGNAAARATERAVGRQLEQRLHDHNEATHYIAAHAAVLGQSNLAELSKQADALARASFVAHVRLELYRRELDRLLADQADVKVTLERSEREGTAELGNSELPKARKAAIQERVTASKAARTALDQEVEAARAAEKGMEATIEALQKDYALLVRTLLDELAHPPPKSASSPKAPSNTTEPSPPPSEADPDEPTPIDADQDSAPVGPPAPPPPAPAEGAPDEPTPLPQK
jgi:hypothetical protein